MLTAVSAFAEQSSEGNANADANGISSEIIEIDSAEKLASINQNLSGRYVLTADIDLNGTEWTPIGAFVMGGGEEGEMPDPAAAFTGTFDGQGHTIKNLTINQPEGSYAHCGLKRLAYPTRYADRMIYHDLTSKGAGCRCVLASRFLNHMLDYCDREDRSVYSFILYFPALPLLTCEL
jgi:hypothetical protein